MLLVVSFFVLATVSKVDSKNLKKFGRVLAIILIIVAAYIFILFFISELLGIGRHIYPRVKMMPRMMRNR